MATIADHEPCVIRYMITGLDISDPVLLYILTNYKILAGYREIYCRPWEIYCHTWENIGNAPDKAQKKPFAGFLFQNGIIPHPRINRPLYGKFH